MAVMVLLNVVLLSETSGGKDCNHARIILPGIMNATKESTRCAGSNTNQNHSSEVLPRRLDSCAPVLAAFPGRVALERGKVRGEKGLPPFFPGIE